MAPRVKLSEIVDALQWQSDNISHALNTRNGKVVVISEEDKSGFGDEFESEGADEELDPKRPPDPDVQDYLAHPDDYIHLPDQFEIHEYQMLESFALSVKDARKSQLLQVSIQGQGAFRRFKDTVRILGLEDQWHAHRDECYREIAREWCEDNKIEYSED